MTPAEAGQGLQILEAELQRMTPERQAAVKAWREWFNLRRRESDDAGFAFCMCAMEQAIEVDAEVRTHG